MNETPPPVPGQAAPNDKTDNKARAGMLGVLLARLSATGRTSASLVIIAIVPLFLVFANTQIKELFDRFVGGCTFVIHKEVVSTGQVQVTSWLSGQPPTQIPLMFVGRTAMINTILFDEPYRRNRITEPDDLAFHPLTNMTCPGALCEASGTAEFRRRAQVLLTDLRPEFTYRFNVRMQADQGQALDASHLMVYALFDSGLAAGVCKVQPRRWFNFWIWAGPLHKSLLFLLMIVTCGLLAKWANSQKEK